MKTKIYYLVLVAGVALIGGSLYQKHQKSLDVVKEDKSDTVKQEAVVEEKDSFVKNYLEGALYKSEELKLGNYKLSSKDGDIYLHTSRDFSALVGYQVLVLINGTKDKFELVDIQSKVSDGGFIKER